MGTTTFTNRPYQANNLADVCHFFASATSGQRRLYAGPTGAGKSVCILNALAIYPDLWVVTPRVEIIAGLLAKLNKLPMGVSENAVVAAGWCERITTPVRLRNGLLAGRLESPAKLCFDEAHHHSAETNTQIDWLCGLAPSIGYTATPYRGSPRSTATLRAAWGETIWMVTYAEAMKLGYISMPRCVMWPLVDDDEITITNGEFVVSVVADAVASRMTAIVARCAAMVDGDGRFDRPTMFACPNTETALQLAEGLQSVGISATAVTQATTQARRQAAFMSTVAGHTALVQINVVSEGVDLPIRRLIDLAPKLSPVAWLQQFGRITRPGGESEYICTNRNLLRHAYLLEGCLPADTVAAATIAFGGPGSRMAQRVLGLEAIGRLRASELPLADGTRGLCYQMSVVDGTQVTEYTCLVHPGKVKPLWAKRQRVMASEGAAARYGRWARCAEPADLAGYASIPASPLSEKQAAWWKKSAKRHGLDPDAAVTRKNFAALPVLADLRSRM